MMRYLFLLIFSISFVHGNSQQNLIINSGFEKNGLPWGDGWFATIYPALNCGELLNASTDTSCEVTFVQDSTGNWSVHPIRASIKYLLTNLPNGKFFNLNLWLKKSGISSMNIRLSINGNTYKNYSVTLYSLWTNYYFSDTLPNNLIPSDTITIVLLNWALNDHNPFYADNLIFFISDTMQAIQETEKKSELSVQINNKTHLLNHNNNIETIKIYDSIGKLITVVKDINKNIILPINSGIVFIEIVTEHESTTHKIFL